MDAKEGAPRRGDWFYVSGILGAIWLESRAESIVETLEPLTVGGSSAVAMVL